jgi:hypothetical protein
MSAIDELQKEVCVENGSDFLLSAPDEKLGIAINSLNKQPLNALRHPPENGTCGWYIWGGEEMPDDPEFFQPLHVSHIKDYCAEMEKYLGLAPGWRVLLAPDQEDVWFDGSLLNID